MTTHFEAAREGFLLAGNLETHSDPEVRKAALILGQLSELVLNLQKIVDSLEEPDTSAQTDAMLGDEIDQE